MTTQTVTEEMVSKAHEELSHIILSGLRERYILDQIRDALTSVLPSTNPAPVVEGETMAHDLEPKPVAPHYSLNERVAKLEAMVKGLRQEFDGVDSNLGTHMHLPNGRTVFAFEDDYPESEDDDADATSAEWDSVERGKSLTDDLLSGDYTGPVIQPTPTEPEPGEDDAKWAQVWGAYRAAIFDPGTDRPLQAAAQRAVELGLVHREPVVIEVTQEDVEAVRGMMSQRFTRKFLEAYADRLRARQEGV